MTPGPTMWYDVFDFEDLAQLINTKTGSNWTAEEAKKFAIQVISKDARFDGASTRNIDLSASLLAQAINEQLNKANVMLFAARENTNAEKSEYVNSRYVRRRKKKRIDITAGGSVVKPEKRKNPYDQKSRTNRN